MPQLDWSNCWHGGTPIGRKELVERIVPRGQIWVRFLPATQIWNHPQAQIWATHTYAPFLSPHSLRHKHTFQFPATTFVHVVEVRCTVETICTGEEPCTTAAARGGAPKVPGCSKGAAWTWAAPVAFIDGGKVSSRGVGGAGGKSSAWAGGSAMRGV